ncbi:putative hydrolase [Diaminobutyricimonas aerilata]|uniref:Putative hydrolase n=1 Tax=Diaminobutyricimonas aerilata TaxID=1162967 RepID=A0A2M9CI85_9MICO|nr:zinc-dependent metalloprotease [Diaminobutyricimonas aerilata]PJJ71623.1 putative hydrolase [Diaminobutyricimonas aerilata]
MADDPRDEPDEFRDMLRDFLSGNSDIDPSKLAGAAGLPNDPEMVARLIAQLQSALQSSGDGINWGLALEQARSISTRTSVPTLPAERSQLEQAFHVAALWLDEATFVAELPSTPRLMSRTEWAQATMPVWTQLAEPVATSIANALTDVLRDQAPEEMAGLLQNAGQLMRNVGGTLFAMQLGQVVGQLSTEVVSGGDVGIPLLDEEAALIPQNVAGFGTGLDIPVDQVQLYLAVRELAHARLFRHAKWLRLRLLTSITEFAHGIRIDTERLEQLAADFDPQNPEELRQAMTSGALIPPKTDEQLAALERLETMLALIEGWVDVVTAEATTRLPRADAIAETVKRRRASGGPAESAFATLVGLELRPRRLREAAAMWRAVTDAVGAERRDALWSHPDLVPVGSDIDDPAALTARLTGPAPEPDDFDRALEDLLGDEGTDRPKEA